MLFNSWQFLIFFPIVTSLYFALAHRSRLWMLLLASCLFYMAFVPGYILILAFTIGVDYFAGLWIARSQGFRRKAFLVASLVANIGVLAFFKYYNFLADSLNVSLGWVGFSSSIPLLKILLPIGLSFHTFQAMSYTIEVYRGAQKPERDLLVYSLYVMFYPQLVAGPIERPQNLLHQFHTDFRFNYDDVVCGLRRMVWGFFKKVFVADRLAILVNEVYGKPTAYPSWVLVLAVYAFTFQIFCDFSGYSDIALGAARVMGFRLMKNFDRPYSARSISEFWKRWHISLSTWFKDYLYIPLGGNRVSPARKSLNVLVVFLVSGLWHGASWTFVVWGGLHGLLMISERWISPVWGRVCELTRLSLVPRIRGWIETLVVFHCVTFAWIFFRASTFSEAGQIISGIFSRVPLGATALTFDFNRLALGPFELVLAMVGILLLEGGQYLNRLFSLEARFSDYPQWVRWGTYYAAFLVIVLFGKFTSQQFLYFQF